MTDDAQPLNQYQDAEGRYLPGSVPGWGMSWWIHEQGITKRIFQEELTMAQRIQVIARFWKAVNEGWWPPVPREQWVGPYEPFEPDH